MRVHASFARSWTGICELLATSYEERRAKLLRLSIFGQSADKSKCNLDQELELLGRGSAPETFEHLLSNENQPHCHLSHRILGGRIKSWQKYTWTLVHGGKAFDAQDSIPRPLTSSHLTFNPTTK